MIFGLTQCDVKPEPMIYSMIRNSDPESMMYDNSMILYENMQNKFQKLDIVRFEETSGLFTDGFLIDHTNTGECVIAYDDLDHGRQSRNVNCEDLELLKRFEKDEEFMIEWNVLDFTRKVSLIKIKRLDENLNEIIYTDEYEKGTLDFVTSFYKNSAYKISPIELYRRKKRFLSNVMNRPFSDGFLALP